MTTMLSKDTVKKEVYHSCSKTNQMHQFFKLHISNFRNWCVWLVLLQEYITMHRSMHVKFINAKQTKETISNLRNWCVWLVSLQEYITMHRPMNVKSTIVFTTGWFCYMFSVWHRGWMAWQIWLMASKLKCWYYLWMRYWTFGLHKMRGISWLAEELLASQEGPYLMEWVSIIASITIRQRWILYSRCLICFWLKLRNNSTLSR
jgi:hypothetical protein